MSGCCTPRGYAWIFSPKRAEAEVRRYRKKGLDRTSRRIAALLLRSSVKGSTVLEVGGGVGALQVELLRAGTARAVNVELIPTYERAASILLREHGLTDRVERRIADFTEIGSGVPAADVVILNRVLCCYPDMPTLAGAAAEHTRKILVLSVPKLTWWTRLLLRMGNAAFRLTRREFQIFLHSPGGIRRAAEAHGLRQVGNSPGLFWQVMAFEASGAG